MAKVSKYGQWKYPGEDTIIPNANGNITMKGVPYPVLGIDDLGNQQMMMPGMNYQFPGNSVYEIPMMAYGGDISIPSLKRVKIKSLPKAQDKGKVKKGKTLFGRPYQVVNMDAGPDLWGNERPGEKTRVKTIYYKNGNVAKQIIENNERGVDEVTWHDKDGNVVAEETVGGYRTFSNGYFQSDNNVDYENVKRIKDEIEKIAYKNKLDGFLKLAKLNLENMSKEGSQPGDSFNTVWPDWENDRFNYTRTKNPEIKRSRAKFAYGGSLPKAQLLGNLTPEQKKEYENRYVIYREQGSDPNEANKLAQVDASYFGTGPIYNFNPFLPDPNSGVQVTSGKRFPYEHIDPNTFNSWQNNYMSDRDFLKRYNSMTPDQQELAKRMVEDNENLDNYYTNLEGIKRWEKNWYSQRAKLPQFTDVANKRLSLVESVNMQPWGNNQEYVDFSPGSVGMYEPNENTVNIPALSFGATGTMAHERSHWYDFNAPQYTDYGVDYNDNDPLLNNILPVEYSAFQFNDPLRRPNTSGKEYDTESEKILGADQELEPTDSYRDLRSIQVPYKTFDEHLYMYKPTEVRARLNEWRLRHNIDPTKNYTNEEIQQIIDKDIQRGNIDNNDLYKVIRGRGDLLKQIHDAYVSTGNKESSDEIPRGQSGMMQDEASLLTNRNRAFQDIIVDDEVFEQGDFDLYLGQAQEGLPSDYDKFLAYSKTAPENRRPDANWQYGDPRQYDHYGMWDALGKPENFNQALEMNPHWQPDPYDGMYHGFSTNPNTGVWLKSHIPGESEPGSTAWMENLAFALSNDPNWGPKNQNLVYDPELQRMRYINREQQGGLQKAQDLGAFYDMFKFTDQDADEEYDWGIFSDFKNMMYPPKQTLEQPKKMVDAVYKPSDEYVKELMFQENGVNKGLKNGRYYPYDSVEGGTPTIGYGHKLTEDEVKSKKYANGLSYDEVVNLMYSDLDKHAKVAKSSFESEFGKGSFDNLNTTLKDVVLDFSYTGTGINKFPNFHKAVYQYSIGDPTQKSLAYAKMLDNYKRNTNGKPLVSRNAYTEKVLKTLK
jgi:hypothetical protein